MRIYPFTTFSGAFGFNPPTSEEKEKFEGPIKRSVDHTLGDLQEIHDQAVVMGMSELRINPKKRARFINIVREISELSRLSTLALELAREQGLQGLTE